MPRHIRITDVKVEHLQDISDKECLREGVKRASIGFYAEGVKVKDCEKEAHRETASGCLKLFPFPRPAFASLINKISGNGTWERNPWVVAYSFELVDQRMDELRREYIIPIKPVEMIDCSYLPNKKSKSRAESTPYASKRKKKRKK